MKSLVLKEKGGGGGKGAGLPDPDKPSLQPKTTATWGPFTATKFFVTATFTATFGAKVHLKAEIIFVSTLILSSIKLKIKVANCCMYILQNKL